MTDTKVGYTTMFEFHGRSEKISWKDAAAERIEIDLNALGESFGKFQSLVRK